MSGGEVGEVGRKLTVRNNPYGSTYPQLVSYAPEGKCNQVAHDIAAVLNNDY